MKATGIVRNLDDLGRVVIPKEIRTVMNIDDHGAVEFFVDESSIIMRSYRPGCLFCGDAEEDNLIEHKGHRVCVKCLDKLNVAAASEAE